MVNLAQTIGAMDYKNQQLNRWQYWFAKAYKLGGTNQQRQTNQLFSQLAQTNPIMDCFKKDQIGAAF